ncbi:MAG: hypothetical protein P8127_07070 [Acidobacteriota bacterium]
MRRRSTLIGVVLSSATTLFPLSPVSAEGPLFSADATLEITILGSLKRLARSTSTGTVVPGQVELGGRTTIPMVLSKYGLSRLEECTLPLLKIDLDEMRVRGTPLEGLRTVRLVTPCHHGSTWDRFILLEYLAYRSYMVIADPALRVRLVVTRFVDTERPSFDETGLSFFLEDIGAAAERHGMEWIDIEAQPVDALDPSQLARFALFQFMIGNTDWSAVAGAEGQRCCHNVAVLGSDGDPVNTLLPFDFDFSGLVDAPYALPDESLPIRHVTQRVYRGFCASNEYLPAAITLFNEKRPELERLFTNLGLPAAKARKRALKYIDSFYATINDPRKVKSRIIDRCR